MTAPQSILDYYAQPSPLTSAGRYAFLFAELPSDVKALVHIIQGLAIYDVVASTFYGCSIGETRADEIHLRSMEQMLEHLLALDNRPLAVARPPDKRLACRCHNFTRFLVAMLRAKGFPARSRCGFGTYFNAGYFEDHWVCEYWHATEARWVLSICSSMKCGGRNSRSSMTFSTCRATGFSSPATPGHNVVREKPTQANSGSTLPTCAVCGL